MNTNKWTLFGAVFAILTYLSSLIFDLHLYERFTHLLNAQQHMKLAELVIPLLILTLFSSFDFYHQQRQLRKEKEKIELYKAMIKGSQHILNHFVNQMHIFKLEAQDHTGFDTQVIGLCDQIKKDAEQHIKALKDIRKKTYKIQQAMK